MTARTRRTVAAMGAVLLLLAGLAWWRSATVLDRNWTPLDIPMRLEEGTTVVRPVGIDRTGRYVIGIEIPDDGPEVRRAVGGGFFGEASPPGVDVSFSLSRDGHVIGKGDTGDQLRGAIYWGRLGIRVDIAYVAMDAGDYEMRAQVTRTTPALLGLDTRLIVQAAGDDYMSAHIAAELLPVVAVALASLGALLLLVFFVSRWRSRRAATA